MKFQTSFSLLLWFCVDREDRFRELRSGFCPEDFVYRGRDSVGVGIVLEEIYDEVRLDEYLELC